MCWRSLSPTWRRVALSILLRPVVRSDQEWLGMADLGYRRGNHPTFANAMLSERAVKHPFNTRLTVSVATGAESAKARSTGF